MASAVMECVPNVSEGRDAAVLARLGDAIRGVPGVTLMDVHRDPDHHRSVFSFLGAPAEVERAALALAGAVVATIDMRRHAGVHPRVGALDVLPFVPLRACGLEDAVAVARRAGRAIGERHGLTVYFYGAAATRPERRALRALRRGQYEELARRLAAPDGAPDAGPARFDARTGAVLVGARPVLVAFNVELAASDVEAAREIARAVRESSGGLPGVQAMGVWLATRGVAQVSMNLVDLGTTPIPAAFDRVSEEAARRGIAIAQSELVGLAPRAAFAGRDPASVGLAALGAERLLDSWL
ncbi:MAG: glutamate formimidoyltransferase [Candidatus Rokubacteria bacterium]|nr:glutamate formimidoyltransferase [Candidatus Rokubacteria bacterium]